MARIQASIVTVRLQGAPYDSSMLEHRKASRFTFEKSIEATIVSIDGTWARGCSVQDVSDAGAKILLTQPLAPLANDEFFLVFTKMGCVFRRCQRLWINGDHMGVVFLKMQNGIVVARSKADHEKVAVKQRPTLSADQAWMI